MAFLPSERVVEGFIFIQNRSQCMVTRKKNFSKYLEKNYIGKLVDGVRYKPRFSIESWNLHVRIKEKKPTTYNPVEALHSSLTSDTRSRGTMNVVLQEIQLEQSKTESHIVRLDAGDKHVKNIRRERKRKEMMIFSMIEQYESYSSIEDFFN